MEDKKACAWRGEKHNLKYDAMELALKESLRNYFAHLAKTDEKWKEFLKSVARPLEALKNQSEQFRHVVSKEVDDAEICSLEGVREKLIYKINIGMEDEISKILNEIERMKNLVADLRAKLERLETVRSEAMVREPSFKELVAGTSVRPRLDLLMEWAIESSTYYSELCATICGLSKTLDYKNTESVTNWIAAFDQDPQKRDKIDKILGFTQFFIKD